MGGAQSRPTRRTIHSSKPKAKVVGITLYQHCDKKGWVKTLKPGEYDITKHRGQFPSDASYIVVPKGYNATIFTGSLDNGQKKSFVGPTEWTFCNENRWANDKIRSIRVSGPSTIKPPDKPGPKPVADIKCPPQAECPPPPPPEVDSRIFSILDTNNLFNTTSGTSVPTVCKDILKVARSSGSLENFLNIYNLTTTKSIAKLSDFVGAITSPTVDQTLIVDSVKGYSKLNTYLTQMETSQLPVIRNVSNCLEEETKIDPKLLKKYIQEYETSKQRYEEIANEDERVSYYEGWFPIDRPLTLTTLYILFAVGLFFIIISILLFLSMQGIELRFIFPMLAVNSFGNPINAAYSHYIPYVAAGVITAAIIVIIGIKKNFF